MGANRIHSGNDDHPDSACHQSIFMSVAGSVVWGVGGYVNEPLCAHETRRRIASDLRPCLHDLPAQIESSDKILAIFDEQF